MNSQRLAIEHDFSFNRFLDSKDRTRHFGAPRADESCNAQHFAFCNSERDPVVRIPEGPQPPNLKSFTAILPSTGGSAFEKFLEVAPDHHPHHAFVSDLRALNLARIFAVAKHYRAIRDL